MCKEKKMKGYPKYFATKEDYENVIRDFPKWRKRVKNELQALKAVKDDKMSVATTLVDPHNEELGWNTMEVPNPNPRFKQKGFKTKKELGDMVTGIEETGEVESG